MPGQTITTNSTESYHPAKLSSLWQPAMKVFDDLRHKDKPNNAESNFYRMYTATHTFG